MLHVTSILLCNHLKAGATVIYVNSQNKITKKYYLKNIDSVVVCLSFAVNMAMFGIINAEKFCLLSPEWDVMH